MDIKYLGHSSFHLKGKNGSVVTDPFDSKMVGLKFPQVEADIITISHHHADHNATAAVSGTPLVLDIPGEYEKGGIRVTGYDTFHDGERGEKRGRNTMFKIEADGLSVLHCGDLGHIPADELIEEIDTVDVLLIPVGGFYTITADEAVSLVSKIEPGIVIPMHYNHPKLNQDGFAQLTPVSDFLKKIGADEALEPVKKLTLKKQDIAEETKVIVMEI